MNRQDADILNHLQRDATLSHQALAERTGMSAATVWRRVQALEKAGIIEKRVALVDPPKAGLTTTVLTAVRLVSHGAENRAAFERLVATVPEILECYSVSGGHDYTLLVRVRDISAYEHFLMNGLLAHAEVASAETSFVLRQIKYETALPVEVD